MQNFRRKSGTVTKLAVSALFLQSCNVLSTPKAVIHDGDITESKMADNAVGTRAIQTGAVTASKLDSSMTLSVANGSFTSNLTVGGNLTVTGTSTHTGAATFASTIAVTGASTLTGNTTVGGTLGITGATTHTGAATFNSTSAFNGASTWTTTTTQPIAATRTESSTITSPSTAISIGGTMNAGAGAASTGSYYGMFGDTAATTAFTYGNLTGVLGRARTGIASSTATIAIGVDSELKFSATTNSETITNGYGFHTKITNLTGNTLTQYRGLYIEDPAGGAATALGGTRYGVVSDGSASKNYFAGPVGLGVATPTNALDVSGAVAVTGNTTLTGNLSASGTVTFSGLSVDAAQQAVCINTATGLLSKTSGSACTTPSDRRLKENIQPIASALDKLLTLTGVSYFWKDKKRFNNERQLGLIAQDIKQVFPEVVHQGKDGFFSVDYQGMIGPIVQAVKELHAKWNADHQQLEQQKVLLGQLEKKIELENLALKSENKQLKDRLDKIEQALARATLPAVPSKKGRKLARQ